MQPQTESSFGLDPLNERQDLIAIRDQHLQTDIGSFDDIYTSVVSSDGHLFEQAIIIFLSLTNRRIQLL